MYLPLLDVFQRHIFDVTKEVGMKLVATHFTCFVVLNGNTQELEPQMEVLQRGEPVEIVADIWLAIRAGSQHTCHAISFLIQCSSDMNK